MLAKAIMPGKFWIIEESGAKVGTIHNGDNVFTVTFKGGLKRYDDLHDLEEALHLTLGTTENVSIPSKVMDEVDGYVTRWNKVANKKVLDGIPMFTKTEVSNSYHAAGYYALKFPNGWTPSFCPRLNTIKSYEYIGPYKSIEDVTVALRRKRGED